MNVKTMAMAALVSAFLIFVASSPSPGKGEKEAIEKLQSEVIILQSKIREMQESLDRTNGQVVTLITQINDSVSVASREIGKIQSALADTQVKVSGNLGNLDSRFLALDSSLRSINERVGKSLDQFTALRSALEKAEKSRPNIDPTDPIQSFSAAYGDYLKGNYPLAIDQFRQYVTRFPNLESADDAQYWIGEALQAMGKSEEAAAEFQKVIENYPQGDRVDAASLKRGLILVQIGRTDDGVSELRALIRSSPNSQEAAVAKQRLDQMGVSARAPSKPAAERGQTRKRKIGP